MMPCDWDQRVKEPRLVSAGVEVHKFESLPQLIYAMTGDERMEAVVASLARQAIGDWQQMRAGNPRPSGEDHKLDVHVEPYLSVHVPNEHREDLSEEPPEANHTRETFQQLERGVQPLIHYWLTQAPEKWLLITEDAGGGKTVLSWQLRAALSQGTSPFCASATRRAGRSTICTSRCLTACRCRVMRTTATGRHRRPSSQRTCWSTCSKSGGSCWCSTRSTRSTTIMR
jgi:hypothetical protein